MQGDIVDRGHDTIKLYKFMMDLRKQAEAVGGRVIQLLGNHVKYYFTCLMYKEIMNMMNDLRYVSAQDTLSFGSAEKRVNARSST